MTVACCRCRARNCRIEWHHPSGRRSGVPIHAFAVPLCVGCHVAEHKIWSRTGLDAAEPSGSVVLRRYAVFCHLESFDELAAEIVELVESMEQAA